MHKLYTQMKIHRLMGTEKEIKLITIKQKQRINTNKITISQDTSDKKNKLSMFGKSRGFLAPKRDLEKDLRSKRNYFIDQGGFFLYDLVTNSHSNKVKFY